MKNILPMNLQLFAEPSGGTPPASEPVAPATPQTIEIDYDKLAGMVSGKQTATEDSVLKGYFKEQGLSQEEIKQAIDAFKQQKAAQQPDVNALQTQLTQAQQLAQQAEIKQAATLSAIDLGIDAKTVPYVLKMADLSDVIGADGKVNDETIKTALNKVLEDIPALKPEKQENKGFQQIGAGGTGQQSSGNDDRLANIFGNKKG